MKKTGTKLMAAVVCAVFLFTVYLSILIPVAAFTGHGATLSDTQLLNATNTYEGAAVNEDDTAYRKVTYNLNNRINKPIASTPQITVLTHGNDGRAGHWSNDYGKSGSVAFAGGANIYWAKMTSYKDFDLINISSQGNIVYSSTNSNFPHGRMTGLSLFLPNAERDIPALTDGTDTIMTGNLLV